MTYSTMQKKKKTGILVLGIGNLLMGDEGLGVHYARRMEQESLPEEVTVLDGGTAGFKENAGCFLSAANLSQCSVVG